MRCIYSGPMTGVSIGEREVMLFDGAEVDLPEGNEFVKTLEAMGRLERIEPESPGTGEPVKKTKKEVKENAG